MPRRSFPPIFINHVSHRYTYIPTPQPHKPHLQKFRPPSLSHCKQMSRAGNAFRVIGFSSTPSSVINQLLTLPDLLIFHHESIQQLLPPASRGPVACIGRVLGNRTTLHKYLNPRLFTVLTVSRMTMCGLYLVDSTKGTVVYLKGRRGRNIKMALTESWLVYHYFEGEVADRSVGGAKGCRMVRVELYEGEVVDEKTSRCGHGLLILLPVRTCLSPRKACI